MSHPILVIDGIAKKQAAGTTLAHLQTSYPNCYLEADDVDYRIPEFKLVNGVSYILKKAECKMIEG